MEKVEIDIRDVLGLQNLHIEDPLEIKVAFDLPVGGQRLFDLRIEVST